MACRCNLSSVRQVAEQIAETMLNYSYNQKRGGGKMRSVSTLHSTDLTAPTNPPNCGEPWLEIVVAVTGTHQRAYLGHHLSLLYKANPTARTRWRKRCIAEMP
jgi:hypothetical protein